MIYKGYQTEQFIQIQTLISMFDRVLGENYYFSGESHNFWELVCVLNGELGVTAGKDVFYLGSGQAVLHRPMEFHRLWSAGKTQPRIVVITFGAETTPQTGQKVFDLGKEAADFIGSLLERGRKIFAVKDKLWVDGVYPEMEYEASIFVRELECMLLKLLRGAKAQIRKVHSVSAENYGRIVRVMERSVGEALTVEEIAERCQMSEASLKKTFSRYTGIGVITYFNRMKIRAAIEMLRQGESVKETAVRLGYTDQNYFSTVFKRVTGSSPRAYMQKVSDFKDNISDFL